MMPTAKQLLRSPVRTIPRSAGLLLRAPRHFTIPRRCVPLTPAVSVSYEASGVLSNVQSPQLQTT